MQPPKLAQFAVSVKTSVMGREIDQCEGGPEVFSEGRWDGLFAEVGELIYSILVL